MTVMVALGGEPASRECVVWLGATPSGNSMVLLRMGDFMLRELVF